MRVLLAGAFGNLGYEILKSLLKSNHEVIAADLKERDTELKGKYTFKVNKKATKIDIARAVEKLFDVKVLKVNTINIS